MVGNSTRVVRATLALILAAGWLRAAPPAMAQGALDGARSVLTRFMDAVIARDADAARALATEELRAQSPGAFVGVSNPCTYRYEVLAFTPTAPGIVAARVRIYQHFWPGDVGGGPPSSFQQDVGLIQTAAGWRVSRLGPQQNARQEPNESHGPTTSACNVAGRVVQLGARARGDAARPVLRHSGRKASPPKFHGRASTPRPRAAACRRRQAGDRFAVRWNRLHNMDALPLRRIAGVGSGSRAGRLPRGAAEAGR